MAKLHLVAIRVAAVVLAASKVLPSTGGKKW
jgi:hypothetical protein